MPGRITDATGTVIYEHEVQPERVLSRSIGAVVVRTQVWLTWTEEQFVSLYLLASEQAWPGVESDFDAVRQSLVLP